MSVNKKGTKVEPSPAPPPSVPGAAGPPTGLTTVFDTGQLDPSDRVPAIRELTWQKVVRVDITHHPEPSRVAARLAVTDLGGFSVCSVTSNATVVQRTPRLARDDQAPRVFLSLQLSGSSMVVQAGREAVLRDGDLAIYDVTQPYTLVNPGGINQHFFRFELADLGIPHDIIRSLTAVRFGREELLGQLTAAYFRRVAQECSSYPLANARTVSAPSIELLRALLVSRLPSGALPSGALPSGALQREALQDSLLTQIMEYARLHLADHDLSAEKIAAAHHISVRRLYAVLARADTSLGDWIRAHRLEQCARELAGPSARYLAIAAIARRWGFLDPTHFGRAFRAAYGVTPRQWRQAHLDPGRATTPRADPATRGARPRRPS